MSIARLHVNQLQPSEREDLEAALREPDRFHSDGRESGIVGVMVPVLLIPLEFVVFNEVRSSYGGYGNPLSGFFEYFPSSISMLWDTTFLPYVGFAALAAVIIAVPRYAVRTRGRHGYAITSFGVVRIRGDKLRVLRYEHIADVKSGSRDYPQHRIVTGELEVRAKNGKSLVLYGVGLPARKELIETYLRASVAHKH